MGHNFIKGDSGGPLVVKTADNNWHLLGVVNWGYDCGQGGVYTRVKAYIAWIQNIIETE